MIYTVTLNPAIDKTVEIDGFTLNAVNRIRALRTDPGGKGINVSKVIQSLGGESMATGLLASQSGAYIQGALEAMGIPTNFLTIPGETRTNLKVIDPVSHTNTDINEPGPQVSSDDLAQLLGRLEGLAQPGDWFVLSGSLPRGAEPGLYAQWIRALRGRGASVILDADGESLRLGIQAKPTLLKPNREELCRLMGRPLPTLDSLAEAGRELIAQGIGTVVISLGPEGALFLTPEGAWQAEGLPITVGSTVGAGDAMVAALALCRQRGCTMEQTIPLAIAASAANAATPGTHPATPAAIHSLLPQVKFYTL